MTANTKLTPSLEYHIFTYVEEKRRKKDKILRVQSKIGLTKELLKNCFKSTNVYNEDLTKALQREIKYKLKLEEHLSTLTDRKEQRIKTRVEKQQILLKTTLSAKTDKEKPELMQQTEEHSEKTMEQQNYDDKENEVRPEANSNSEIPTREEIEANHNTKPLPLTSASLTQLNLQLQNLMILKLYLEGERQPSEIVQNVELNTEKNLRLTEWIRQQNKNRWDVESQQLEFSEYHIAKKQETVQPILWEQQTFGKKTLQLAYWVGQQNEKWKQLSAPSNWCEVQRV